MILVKLKCWLKLLAENAHSSVLHHIATAALPLAPVC